MAFNQTVYNKVDIETFQNSIIDQYGAQVTYTTTRPVKLLFKTSNLAVLKTYTLTISNANDSKEFVLSDPGVLTTENIGGINYQVVNFNDTTFAFTTGTQLFSFSKQGDDASGLGTVNYNDARYAANSHTQAISTINGLQDALDAKQDYTGAMRLAGSQTVTGGKVFTVLPTSTITPTTADQFTRKGYVDNAIQQAIQNT